MDRSDAAGLAFAVVAHGAIFALLSASFLFKDDPVKSLEDPIEVSLVDDVGLVATAPQSRVPPAESRAPDAGPPEDAAPPEPKEAAPAPVPPAPQPDPVPPPKPA